MTFEEISVFMDELLGSEKVAYYSFSENEAPTLPYLIFYYPESKNILADDGVYLEGTSLNLELYSSKKDIDLEKEIEKKLVDKGLVYEKSEAYIESENMYEILYEMEVIIDGKS